jgi:hypothetical protein
MLAFVYKLWKLVRGLSSDVSRLFDDYRSLSDTESTSPLAQTILSQTGFYIWALFELCMNYLYMQSSGKNCEDVYVVWNNIVTCKKKGIVHC